MATEQQSRESPAASATPGPIRRMPRAQRREQIVDAATRAFARAGYSDTNLDDVAGEAGITRVLLYRHFDSKTALYRAVLDRVCTRLAGTVGADHFDDTSIPALLQAAADDPDGFRLLFRYAAREPEFRDLTDALTTDSTQIARQHLTDMPADDAWTIWAAQLLPAVTIEAVIAWLDAGQPDPDQAAERIAHAVHAVIEASSPR